VTEQEYMQTLQDFIIKFKEVKLNENSPLNKFIYSLREAIECYNKKRNASKYWSWEKKQSELFEDNVLYYVKYDNDIISIIKEDFFTNESIDVILNVMIFWLNLAENHNKTNEEI